MIWSNVPKEHNLPPQLKGKGEYIRYVNTDPKYLYLTGFVDEKTYTEDDWEAAFQDCRQPDGSYLISKEKFLSLGKYKFSGPIKKPLDALRIREGWYDLYAWHEFCVKSIIPSTTLTVENLVQIEKFIKEKGHIVNGRIRIDKSAKLRIKQFLDNFPSISRRRELSVHKIHQERVQTEVERSKHPGSQATTYQRGQRVGEKDKKELKETLLKNSKLAAAETKEEPTLSIKDMRKKSKTKKQTL
ncbi:MAG: hypothetical protein U1F57_06235 [bacterium]